MLKINKNILRILSLGLGLTILSCSDNKIGDIIDLGDDEKKFTREEIEFITATKEGKSESEFMRLFEAGAISDDAIVEAFNVALNNGNDIFHSFLQLKVFPTRVEAANKCSMPPINIEKVRPDIRVQPDTIGGTRKYIGREEWDVGVEKFSDTDSEEHRNTKKEWDRDVNLVEIKRNPLTQKWKFKLDPKNFFTGELVGSEYRVTRSSTYLKELNDAEKVFIEAAMNMKDVKSISKLYSKENEKLGYDVIWEGVVRALRDKNICFLTFFVCEIFPRLCDEFENDSIENTEYLWEFLALLRLHGYQIGGVFGSCPIHWAVVLGKDKLISKLQFQVNAKDSNGDTPIILAFQRKNLKLINLLIKLGANVNARYHNRNTLLHLAILERNADIAKCFLPFIKVNTENDEGHTPLYLACKWGNKNIINVLTLHDVYEPIAIRFRYHNGNTLLHLAILERNADVVECLAREDGLGFQNNDGNTPLHLAAEWGNEAIVRCLIENLVNCDINVKNNDGYTPLQLAEKKNNKEVSEYLALLLRIELRRKEEFLKP